MTFLLLLPITTVMFLLMFFGAVESVAFYDSSIAGGYTQAMWYQWPWNWPGVHIIHTLMPVESSPGILAAPFAWLAKLSCGLLAMSINLIIAMLPIFMAYSLYRSYSIDLGDKAK